MKIASDVMPYCLVGLFLVDPEKNLVLLFNDKETSEYTIPISFLEFGEEWEECAARKLYEDTGIVVSSEKMRHVSTFNCLDLERDYHSIAIFLYYEINSQTIELKNNYFFTNFEFLKEKFDTLIFNMKVFLQKYPNIVTVRDFTKIMKVK
jgi:ADP-ribose pyrophosphatase YjhB (NUDIX family)